MHTLYQSDSFVVLRIEVPGSDAPGGKGPARGGYEIVDRLAQREIFLDGLLAERFQQAALALAQTQPSEEDCDAFIGRWSALAQQPLTLH